MLVLPLLLLFPSLTPTQKHTYHLENTQDLDPVSASSHLTLDTYFSPPNSAFSALSSAANVPMPPSFSPDFAAGAASEAQDL